MTSLPTTTSAQPPSAGQRNAGLARGGSQPAPGLNFHDILGMLLRNIWLILAVFLAIQVLVWGGYALSFKYLKEFTAVGRMQIVPQKSAYERQDPYLDRFRMETQKRDEAATMLSEDVLMGLISQPTAKNWPWYQTNQGDTTEPLVYKLMSRMSAVPVKDSLQIEVTMRDDSPEQAMNMVNRLMDYYAERSRQRAWSKTEGDRRALDVELRRLRSNLESTDRALQDLNSSPDFELMEQTRPEIVYRVQNLGQLRMQLLIQLQSAQRNAESVKKATQDPNWKPSADLQLRIESDPTLLNLEARKRGLLEERSVMLDRKIGQNHPVVRALDVRIDEVDAAIRSRRAELLEVMKALSYESAMGNVEGTEAALEYVQKQLTVAEQRKKDLENLWTQYQKHKTDRARTQQEIDRVNRAIRQIEVDISRGVREVEVAIPAGKPRRISFPRWEMFLAAGLFLGLALAVGLAWAIEFMDTRVRTPRDLAEQTRLPLLGFVPLIGEDEAQSISDACQLSSTNPTSMLAECFRQIRTNLLFTAPADQLNAVAVTSAAQGEGKTLVACNLAITLGLSGRRVLLIDANFRRSALAGVFGIDGSAGLSNVLTSQSSLSDCIQAGNVVNVSVLPSGPTPPNPAELLGSATMRALLDQASADFDLVIVDSPPALLVSDPLVLSSMVDGVIVVVRAKQTSRGMVNRLRGQLGKVGARMLGAVLNAAEATRGGYFRKSREQYERYHQEL